MEMYSVPRVRRLSILLLIATGLSGSYRSEALATPNLRSQLQGAWEKKGGGELINFAGDRIILWENGRLGVRAILRTGQDELVVRNSGVTETWRVSLSESGLKLDQANSKEEFRRLANIPPEVELKALHFPKAFKIPTGQVESIRKEISERLARDQVLLKDASAEKSAVDRVLSDNAKYLRTIVKEVGWIDAPRFGSKTSYDAVILAKHSGDLTLLLAALPTIEADFKHSGDDAEAFAIVYDSIQLDLGEKQRYGTQLREGAGGGEPYVVALEDPSRVDEFRKEIALPPLADYLELASKYLFNGKKIIVPKGDE